MTCSIKGCTNEEEIVYYGKPICWHHWSMHCENKHKFDLKRRLGLKKLNGQITLA